MIKRHCEQELIKLAKTFKCVAVVGPRQSGKTTLVKHVFKEKPYISLENPDTRSFALDDPRGFLSQYPKGAILDEVQRAPEIFSYLQQILDESTEKGLFILTGSNNFILQASISQSLAGRVAYLFLLPFALYELSGEQIQDIYKTVYQGLYPPIHDQKIEPDIWYPNYIRTYIERDVRLIKNISNLNLFERFVKLCAGRVGQLLNMNNLAIETGVDNKTISSWMGILESSFVIFRLQPHFQNFNKRIVKMPKLYFYDTGLACSLLGIHDPGQLAMNHYFGALFENLIISEFMKFRFNKAKDPNIYFWRDNTGNEVDVVIESGTGLFPVELKAGKTITSEFFKGLEKWLKISGAHHGAIVYAGDEHQKRSNDIEVLSWKNFKSLFSMF
jgi:uncharacterized protein